MNPAYFGTSVKPLLGLHHPPHTPAPRPAGVVLCAPMGREYMRTHWALRQLAALLTNAGFHAFRFDYYATGDSAGEGEEADVGQWVDDVGAAIEELKETALIGEVSLVGLRIGATIAATAARARDDIRDLVLWDPVVSGRAYVDELLAPLVTRESGRRGAFGTVGVDGFPVTPRLREGLSSLDLLSCARPLARRTLVVVSGERPEYVSLREHWRDGEAEVAYRHIPSPGDWDAVDRLGAALLPRQIMQGIVEFLAGGAHS